MNSRAQGVQRQMNVYTRRIYANWELIIQLDEGEWKIFSLYQKLCIQCLCIPSVIGVQNNPRHSQMLWFISLLH